MLIKCLIIINIQHIVNIIIIIIIMLVLVILTNIQFLLQIQKIKYQCIEIVKDKLRSWLAIVLQYAVCIIIIIYYFQVVVIYIYGRLSLGQ
jgi:hypothetical protein